MIRVLSPTAGLLSVGLIAMPAVAQSSGGQLGWSLHWQAPAACPSEAAVRAEVQSLLAGSTRADVALSVTGEVLAVNEGFEVELRFESSQGPAQRVLSGRDCKEVAKAAALVIALAVDPGVKIDPNRQSALETPPEPAPEPSAPPPVVASPKTEAAPPRTPPEAIPSHTLEPAIAVLAAVAAEWGTLPAVAFGLRAGASLGLGPWRATLTGDFFPSRTYDADQDTRLRLTLLGGSLQVGYTLALGDHALTPELGLRLGNLSASARDADAPSEASSLLWGPQAGLRGTLHAVGPLGFWLGLHSGLHLQRPRLVVENRGVAHQPERLWASGAMGLSLGWP